MRRHLRRMPLELGLDLNINRLLRDGIIEPGQATPFKDVEWFDAAGDVSASANISADMTMADCDGTMRIVADWIDQTIQLVSYPRHFGGRQWCFKCPRDNRNVAVLWSPPGKRLFAGRKSWGSQFAYLSQFYGPGQRAHYTAIKLCERIGGPGASGEWYVPPKPKWMRWETYQRLCDRCERHWRKATTLPIEYRFSGDVV